VVVWDWQPDYNSEVTSLAPCLWHIYCRCQLKNILSLKWKEDVTGNGCGLVGSTIPGHLGIFTEIKTEHLTNIEEREIKSS
jgi:hypothetical protein